jgi:glycosyltransferase involved in cell wall biosynthesis
MQPASGQVIHNPVPPRTHASPEALAEADALWGGRPGERLLSVGSFKAAKNQDLLLRAFARIESAEARLMLVGRGEAELDLRTLARNLGVEERVIFAGFRHDPAPFYMTADLFVLSSDREGFGSVIAEALAAGTPVVSTNCPSGPAEILENGRWGRLVPVGDVGAFAAAIQEVLSADHDRDALKQRAADFDLATAAEKYLNLLLPGWRKGRVAALSGPAWGAGGTAQKPNG